MAGAAHPHAMAPSKPGPTRTAPPQMPASWWSHPRIRTYLLFDATGLVYLLLGLMALRVVWALGAGPEVWDVTIASLSNPLFTEIGGRLLERLAGDAPAASPWVRELETTDVSFPASLPEP